MYSRFRFVLWFTTPGLNFVANVIDKLVAKTAPN